MPDPHTRWQRVRQQRIREAVRQHLFAQRLAPALGGLRASLPWLPQPDAHAPALPDSQGPAWLEGW